MPPRRTQRESEDVTIPSRPLLSVPLVQRVLSFAPRSAAAVVRLGHTTSAWSDTVRNYSGPIWERRIDTERHVFQIGRGDKTKQQKNADGRVLEMISPLGPRMLFFRACTEESLQWLVPAMLNTFDPKTRSQAAPHAFLANTFEQRASWPDKHHFMSPDLAGKQRHYVNKTPLSVAVDSGRTEVTKHLLRAASSCRDFLFCNCIVSPLHTAVKNQNIELVKLMLDSKVFDLNYHQEYEDDDVDAEEGCMMLYDATPLHIACALHNMKLVKMLLAAGADPEGAVANVNKKKKKNDDDDDDEEEEDPYTASHTKNYPDLNLGNGRASPLYVAAAHGYTDIVRHLIGLGCGVDRTMHEGCGAVFFVITPLNAAVNFNHASTVRALIEAGAAVDVDDNETNQTAIHIAKSLNVAKMLVDAGADINRKSEEGTPVEVHLQDGRMDIVKFLLKHPKLAPLTAEVHENLMDCEDCTVVRLVEALDPKKKKPAGKSTATDTKKTKEVATKAKATKPRTTAAGSCGKKEKTTTVSAKKKVKKTVKNVKKVGNEKTVKKSKK